MTWATSSANSSSLSALSLRSKYRSSCRAARDERSPDDGETGVGWGEAVHLGLGQGNRCHVSGKALTRLASSCSGSARVARGRRARSSPQGCLGKTHGFIGWVGCVGGGGVIRASECALTSGGQAARWERGGGALPSHTGVCRGSEAEAPPVTPDWLKPRCVRAVCDASAIRSPGGGGGGVLQKGQEACCAGAGL